MNIFKLCKWCADIKRLRTVAVEGNLSYNICNRKITQSTFFDFKYSKNNSNYILNNTYVYCLYNTIDFE